MHNLQTTFGNSIGKLEWMDAETKANAGKKLGKISNKIGTSRFIPDRSHPRTHAPALRPRLPRQVAALRGCPR